MEEHDCDASANSIQAGKGLQALYSKRQLSPLESQMSNSCQPSKFSVDQTLELHAEVVTIKTAFPRLMSLLQGCYVYFPSLPLLETACCGLSFKSAGRCSVSAAPVLAG